MTRKDQFRMLQIAIVSTLGVWGLLIGMSSGSRYQPSRDLPFNELTMITLSVMVGLGLLLALWVPTRALAKAIALSVAAFVFMLLVGHLMANWSGDEPEVPTKVDR
jgi:hypothetical protein